MTSIGSFHKFLFLFIAFLNLPFALFSEYTLVEDQMPELVKTPSLKKIQRRKMRLANGLEAILISDPDTHKSGASLSVGVGNAHEPFEQVGLAHFVEHMLFMGTEQYPIEKEYHEFIQENGGSTNAYTASNQTVYMFEINNEKMSEALLRFGSFFDKPLFNASSLSRERQAVDHEFSYRANIDTIRQFLVMLEMTKEDHPLHTWRCGTKETLSLISREELVNWYEANYGANKMKLAVYSAQTIEEMTEQVDQIFSVISENKESLASLETPIVDPKNLGQKVYIEPIKDLKSLTIQWEVPSEFAVDLDHHTMDLVSRALSEEYSTSLASYLKKQGLIQNLSAGGYTLENQIAFFQISMELSEKGVYQVDQIIGHCFEAIAGLKKEGIPRYRFDEMVNMAKTNYHYQSRPHVFNYISETSSQMQYESLETYPQKNSWPTQFSPDRNQVFLNTLTAGQAIYFVMAPNSFLNKELNQTEKLSGAKFSVEPISDKQLKAWDQIGLNALIGMAPPNPYTPTQMSLVTQEAQNELKNAPKELVSNERSQVFFETDSFYQVPKVYYNVCFNTPKIDSQASSQVLMDLYLLAMSDGLSALADQGSLAGIHYGLAVDPNLGLKLVVQGYSEKAGLYLQEIVEKLKTHRASKEDFLRYYQRLSSFYENQMNKQMPYAQAGEVANSLLIKDYTTYEQKWAALKAVDFETAESFNQTLFDQVYIRALLYGNLHESEAVLLSDFLEDSFKEAQVYPLSQQKRRSILEFDDHSSPHFISEQTEMEGNAALLVIGQGSMDPKKLACLNVFAKAVNTPFFDTLRTKQQTGYLVQSYSQNIERRLFSFFVVFSSTHAPRDLLARFELFNEDFLKTLNTDDFNQEKFEVIKQSIITSMEKPAPNLAENGNFLMGCAFDYQGDFDLKAKRLSALKDLSFEDFLSFSQNYFGRANPGRIAVLVEGSVNPETALDYRPVQNIQNFKSQLFYTSADLSIEPKEAQDE